MITGIGIHLRPMIRKGKSLLFGQKNGGSGGGTAENRHLSPKKIPFLAELDISEKWQNMHSQLLSETDYHN